MAVFQVKTFADIYNMVIEELKIQSGDTVSVNRIKRDINAVYLTEVVPAERWKWLRGFTDITLEPAISAGTANVTQNNKTVTLSTAPGISVTGYNFSVGGSAHVYRVLDHTANSTTVTLDAAYIEASNTTASYTIWQNKLPLPADTRDVIEINSASYSTPLEGKGLQEFRRLQTITPVAEGNVRYFSLGDYVDPDPYTAISGLPALSTRASSGLVKTLVFAADVSSLLVVGDRIKITSAGEDTYMTEAVVSSVSTTTITYTGKRPATESATADASLTVTKLSPHLDGERYRELLVYPAIDSKRQLLNVDYIKNPEPLEDDDDQPLIPIEDRIILVYGALSRAWTRERNPEEASRNEQLFVRKLGKMQGKLDDSVDPVRLIPNKTYLGVKRSSLRQRGRDRGIVFGAGGGTGANPDPIINTASRVAIFNGSGELDASSSIDTSELEFLNDNEGLKTVTLNDNQASAANVVTFTASSYTAIQLVYSIVRGSANIETGLINLVNDGSSAGIAQGAVASLGTIGVTLSADVSGSDVRLRYTSTSTGTAPTLKYKVQKWQA